MIHLDSVTFGYAKTAPVLRGVHFGLPSGSILALAGANGSGKSTLLSLLAGLHAPDSGSLAVEGVSDPARLRRTVGLVLQDAELMILGATVAEDICLGLESHDDAGRETARRLAEGFGLLGLWDAPVQTLSYGQKRKLTLAAALRDAPSLLCLDEPFAGLDYPAVLEVRSILAANRKRGLTQVVAAHDVEPLAGIADAWAVLCDGCLEAYGKAESVFPKLLECGVRPPCAWLESNGAPPWPPA